MPGASGPPPKSFRAMAVAVLLSGLVACVDQAAAHRVRANEFLRRGDAAKALEECDLGLSQKKDDVALLILRGKALFELERLDDARASYAGAIAAGKGDDKGLADAHLGLGVIASRQKDWQKAREHFTTLVRINERDATSHLNVARTCLELKDLECAIRHGESAGRIRGDDQAVLYTLGTIYLEAGKPKEAELTFAHICEVVPSASSCPYGLALVAAKAGDKPKALAKLAEAIERKVPNPDSIAKEPGFASLKDDPEFLALVEKAKR